MGKRIFIIGIGISLWFACKSQTVLIREHSVGLTVPEIAILDIEPDNSALNLGFSLPSEAGLPVVATGNSGNTKWINYTSSISQLVSSRSVEVQISNGTVPPGVELMMEVSAYSGSGAGVLGTGVGIITLSASPQTCISGIGGAYTGNGPNNGHQLTYSLGISNYIELDASQSTVIELIFTMVDN